MFDMVKIGRKIAELRKKKNMTQFELADKMGISFQAVSGWERGISMPDISKLGELGDILGASIDEILCKSNPAVSKIVNNESFDESITKEDIAEAASISKPETVSELINSEKVDLDGITVLLPFMSEEGVAALAARYQQEGKRIVEFLPFMDEDDIDELVKNSEKLDGDISEYLPFMSEESVAALAARYQQEGKRIVEFLPFMDEDDIDELVKNSEKLDGDISEYLPFMSEEGVAALAARYQSEDKRITEFLPFMDEDDITECMKTAYSKRGIKAIAEYLPFLDNSAVDDITKDILKDK